MHLDSNGLVVMDQESFPGNIGDSCCYTSNMVTLQFLLNIKITSNLSLFITPSGVIRYPTSPWGPTDTSADQVAPLLAACQLTQPALANQVISQIQSNGWKTGNGNIINPGLLAQLKRCESSILQSVWDLAILGQALIFMLPWAWNSSATLNPTTWLVSASTQTSGYLNWINALAFARTKKWTLPCWLSTKLVSKNKALAAVTSYYKPEPNSAWLLALYAEASSLIWK
jgi:hypothetical protein